MPLIEGIGDEVVALAAFLVVATTIVAAWFSTRVPARPGPQVRVVQARITHIRGTHQGPESTTSTSTAAESPGGNEEGGENNTTNASSVSECPQETDPERTNISPVEPTERSFDESISNTASSETAQSQTISSAKTVEQTVDADDTDSAGSRKEKSDISIETSKSQEQAVEELGETVGGSTSSGIEELGSNLYSEAENQRTDDENVLRNRNTGQIYPTLPPYGSANQASGGVSEGASNVEDIRTEGDDEETSRAPEGGICIRVKFSSEGERLVHTTPEETLGQFRRQNFVEEIEAGKLVRFIANGQFLSDDSQTLTQLNMTNNSVLHCHVTQGEQIRQAQHNAQDHDLDLGHLMVPLFGCILAFVWYLRWQYRYMFNATSTLSLIGVSVLFFLAVLAAWRG